jgi:predicted HTH domain antitoxin
MTRIQFHCPEDLVTGKDPSDLARLAQEAFLARMYQLGHISSGRASEILHISRREFLDLLAGYGISIFDEDMDVAAEARYGR